MVNQITFLRMIFTVLYFCIYLLLNTAAEGKGEGQGQGVGEGVGEWSGSGGGGGGEREDVVYPEIQNQSSFGWSLTDLIIIPRVLRMSA